MKEFSLTEVAAIRECSLFMDRSGQVPEQVLQIIYDKRLFKWFVPERYNGRLTGLSEALRVFEEASSIDGSFGWLVTIGSGGGYFVSCFPPNVSEEVYAAPEAVIAGSGTPTGTAARVEGGYRVTGAWKYCSGAPFATTFTATALIDGGPDVLAFALRPDQVEVVPDWRSFGLRATGSHSIVVKDAFVPSERAFQVGNPQYDDHSIYRYPFAPFAVASFAAVSLGIGKHFLEQASLILKEQRDRWDHSHPARTAAVEELLAQGTLRLQQHADSFYEAIDRSWSAHGQGGSAEHEHLQAVQAGRALASAALSAAQAVFPLLGMTVLMEDHPLNRIWRDLHTVCQHASLQDIS